MAAILRVRLDDGTVVDIPAIVGPQGPHGKGAYESAVEGGYTGTEEDLNRALAQITAFISGGGSQTGAHAQSHAADGVDPITPDMIGAAAAEHSHTAEEIGAAEADHSHTAADVGAAPAYTYGTDEVEAGSESTEPEGTLHFVIE